MGNRLHLSVEGQHWSDVAAEMVLAKFPNLDIYTCAAGISPSGIVHFGNFRDVMTSFAIADALKRRGKNTRLLFSWDNYDRFRKVPAGVPAEYSRYIGMPLSAVPDPTGEYPSYARRFEVEFENSMSALGITLDYRYQSEEYRAGRYDTLILQALAARKEIAEVLLGFMSDKGKSEKKIDPAAFIADFYPISVYSRFSGKDTTKVLSYDGDSTIEYLCHETGNKDTADLRKDRLAKLAWKIDWPMRWGVEQVVFEPGGHDHASPGGSYDVSSAIANKIFKREPPLFVGYQFIGLQGLDGKMSGSKGQAVSPLQLLEIYETGLLKWLYTRKTPDQGFNLAFDTEIIRQYDELDREVESYNAAKLEAPGQRALEIAFGSGALKEIKNPIPFKQAVALGQILQWNAPKVMELSSKLNLSFAERSVIARLPKARAWLETYNRDKVIKLLGAKNDPYIAKITSEGREHIKTLRGELGKGNEPIEGLEAMVYQIPKKPELNQKENSVRQRQFFKDVYNLLIGSDTGPRLSTFLWAVDRKVVLELLDI